MATSRDPVRLRDLTAGQDVSGVGAGELFREASSVPQLSEAEALLMVRRARAMARRPRWPRVRLAFSLTSLPVLLFGVTVGAATTAVFSVRWRQAVPPAADTHQLQAAPPARAVSSRPPVRATPPFQPETHLQSADPPSHSGGEALAPPAQPQRLRRSPAPALPAPAAEPEAPPGPIDEPLSPSAADAPEWALPPSQEAQMLRQAVRALRTESRPAVALDLLQAFVARYPQSNLKPEADWLLVEAHMRLGQRSAALAVLDEMQGAGRRPSVAALVLRAELLAAQNECAEASRVFAGALGQATTADLVERALYGRAVCLARQGEAEAARASYEDYQRRFPHGRFMESVRRALVR